MATDRLSRSTNSAAISGTRLRSQKAWHSDPHPRQGAGRALSAPQRSPRCTTKPRAPRKRTGRRSWRFMKCSRECRQARWSRSIARLRSPCSNGPRAGLALLRTLDEDERMAHNHRLDAVRGHLLEMAGEPVAARYSYLRAARMTASLPEQRYLALRAARLN